MYFTKNIIDWYLDNKRDLPWRRTKDPYCIWLSEIILQQTRVAQGLAYFEALTTAFPTVFDLAGAEEDVVMKLWQGLGYYSRARNLHSAAKQIVEEFDGDFPDNYDAIKSLKGVGDYTAAAIASFAFGLPHAVVDGNVYRLLSRYFGIETPIDTTAGKKEFSKLANELMDETKPDVYNQALMEFGSMQCTPKSPDCSRCPLHTSCEAFDRGLTAVLPIKSKKIKQRDRYFTYIIPVDGLRTVIRKRVNKKDIWHNLYEFPLLETENKLDEGSLIENIVTTLEQEHTILHISNEIKHVLSHQILKTRFVVVKLNDVKTFSVEGGEVALLENLGNYALPRLIDRFLENAQSGMFPIL